MALQGSGTIKLSQIAAEFGVSAPYSITDFYRGGANVPNITANNGVPTSGAISLTDFYGAQAATDWIVTEGSYGDADGYFQGTYGSIGGVTTINGAAIVFLNISRTVIKGTTSYLFQLGLSGNRAAGFFSSLIINGGPTFNEAAASTRASYDSGNNRTSWLWGGTDVPSLDGTGETSGSYT